MIKKPLAVAVGSVLGLYGFGMPIAFAEEAAQEQEIQEEIVTTGSRIQRNELSQPTPIIQVDAEDLRKSATPDLGSYLAELPAVGSTATLSGNAAGGAPNRNLAGISSADLRRLGAARTLVLVNGKRNVAAIAGSAQVDLSTIPASMIERVEVVTGGASAIYGSDAVSGVVNVILRDSFEGASVNLNTASSTEGVGGSNQSASVVLGTNFAEDDGNVTVFAGYDRIGAIAANDIRQFDNFSNVTNPLDTGENDGIPDRFLVPNVLGDIINGTSVLLDFNLGIISTFDREGNPIDQATRVLDNNIVFGSFPDGCDTCLILEDTENYLPEVERNYFGSTFHYDINDNMTAYGSLRYVDTDIVQLSQPDLSFGQYVINVAENAYLDDTLRQDLLDNGQPFVLFAKFFEDFGNRNALNNREMLRYTAGLKGDFSLGNTSFDYDFYYIGGRSNNTIGAPNVAIVGNVEAALDSVIDPATGLPACRSQVPDAQGDDYTDPATVAPDSCAPFNPFGFGQFSEEARDFITTFTVNTEEINQRVLGASFVTNTEEFFELPGGPIDVAFGFEYRKEQSETVFDGLIQAGVIAGGAVPNSFGEYDVNEYFVEVSLPLLADVPLARELTVDAAYRSADYSHAGDASAWKVGLSYAPFEDIRLRGTISEAVRAPNIAEAFSPVSPGFGRLTDPCSVARIGDDEDRAANCAALGIPEGFVANDAESIIVESGGNPNLDSERSESYTTGIVWTPSFLDGFSLTADYYDIEISDAIILVNAQNIANNCVDAAGGPDAVFCSAVDRDPTTFDVTRIRSGFLNAAALTTKGIELAANYRGISLDSFGLPGEVDVSFFANRLLELEFFEFQSRPDTVNVEDGEVGDPSSQYSLSVAYQLDNLTLNWSLRHVDRTANFRLGVDTPEDLSPAFIPTIITQDLSATYRLNDNVSITGGIRNLTDKVPPGYTFEPQYDLIGRKAFMGVQANF